MHGPQAIRNLIANDRQVSKLFRQAAVSLWCRHTSTDAGTAAPLAERRPKALLRALTVRENEDERRARPGSATAASCSAAIT